MTQKEMEHADNQMRHKVRMVGIITIGVLGCLSIVGWVVVQVADAAATVASETIAAGEKFTLSGLGLSVTVNVGLFGHAWVRRIQMRKLRVRSDSYEVTINSESAQI